MKNKESNQNQPALAGQNAQAHAHAAQSENKKLRAGGVSRAAPCSGLDFPT